MGHIIHLCSRQFDLKSITVEPVMFLYMFSVFLQFITFQALVYEKVCIRNFNETVCSNIENVTYKVQEDFVQKTTSSWILYSNLAMGLPSLLTVVLFLGPWGDRVGRKIPVISPLIGAILVGINNIINSVYIKAPLEYLLIGNFLNGFFGGYIAALMAMYSYIAHVSTAEYRTVKIGILEAMIFLSGTVGTALSGVILDHTSYIFVFSLLVGIMVLALFYTILWVDNVKPEDVIDTEAGGRSTCQMLFLDAVKDVVFCVYGKRKNKHFLHIILLIIIIFFLMLATVGENDVILIFTRHRPFKWSQTTLGLYKGTETFLRGIAVLTLLPLMKRKFQVRDTVVVILGLTSKTVAFLVLGIGKATAVLFIGAISGILQGFGSAGIRSLCAGMVASNEQAKLFSLIGMFESVASIVATSMFNTVYNATLDFYPGFCFLLAAGLTGCCIFIAVFLHVSLSRDRAGAYGTLQEDVCSNEEVIDQHSFQGDDDIHS